MRTKKLSAKSGVVIAIAALFVAALVFGFAFASPKRADAAESKAQRSPAYTYIIGDASVTDENGFTFDESSKTYRYKAHADGKEAAVAKSAELFDENSADANLVEIKLASKWNTDNAVTFSNVNIGGVKKRINVILDLNGFDIDRGLTAESGTSGKVIGVSGGSVEITDTDEEAEGKITGGYGVGEVGAGVSVTGSDTVLILSGGSIEGNYGHHGGGISFSGDKFIMNGGSVAKNTVSQRGNGIDINGGEFIMNGGIVCDNGSKDAPKLGGGILVRGGTATINGGIITGNYGSSGAGIRITADGSVTINGGEISHNIASDMGGGVFAEGSLTVNGGEISYNLANHGGGVYCTKANSLETKRVFSDCIITENRIRYQTATQGGGVLIQGGFMEISGAVGIFDNAKSLKAEDDENFEIAGSPNDIAAWQGNEMTVRVVGELKNNEGEAAKIGVLLNDNTSFKSIAYTDYAEHNKDENGTVVDPSVYFHSNSSTYKNVVLNSDGGIELTNGKLEWTVSYESGLPEKISGFYGKSFVYGEKVVTGVSLTQDSADVNVTFSESRAENAGTYTATATVKNSKNENVTTVFTVKIRPFSLVGENGELIEDVTAALSAGSGWTADNGIYKDSYDGMPKDNPTVSVTLKGSPLAEQNFDVVYTVDGREVQSLKDTGEYTVTLKGTGNYCGESTFSEKFVIMQNTSLSYDVKWQYFNGTEWADISEAEFVFANADQSASIRVSLTEATTGETRYVYANGVTDFNETAEENITANLGIEISKGGEDKIFNAGEYALKLVGEPNYAVDSSATVSAVSVAKFDLSELQEGAFESSAAIDGTKYNGKAKEITFSAAVTLGGKAIEFGSAGAEYALDITYGNSSVDSILLGGDYAVSLRAIGNNFTGTIKDVALFTIERADNRVTVGGIGAWTFGGYNKEVSPIEAKATYLHEDGAKVYYTVLCEDETAADEALKDFTEITDDVIAALNKLSIGNYTVTARVSETESYFAASGQGSFRVVKSFNGWRETPNVISWIQGKFDEGENKFVGTPMFGEVTYSITDADGNVYFDATTDNRAKMKAGKYFLTATVAGTDNYDELSGTFVITVFKKAGMPGWGVFLVVLGCLIVLAAVYVVLHKTGVLQTVTGKMALAMRNKANADATIAMVKMNKKAKEEEKRIAAERLNAARAAAAAEKAKPPAEQAATLTAKAEKMRKRADTMEKRAEKLLSETEEKGEPNEIKEEE